MQQTIATLLKWCRGPRGDACRYVVTPNTDHAVIFQHRAELQAAYGDAALVLADVCATVVASRVFGEPLPGRVAGSDLVPQIFANANQDRNEDGDQENSAAVEPLRVFLLGAAPGVAERAAARIEAQWPLVKVVGTYSPPIGFEQDEAENARIFTAMRAVEPDMVIIGLGALRQEIWAHRHCRDLPAKVAICGGDDRFSSGASSAVAEMDAVRRPRVVLPRMCRTPSACSPLRA